MVSSETTFRVYLFVIGLLAGLTGYFLIDLLPSVTENHRLIMVASAFAYVVFKTTLLTAGVIKWSRLFIYALGWGVILSGLLLSASYRFVQFDNFLDNPPDFLAFGVLSLLALPFFIARETGSLGWRDYEVLFQRAWGIFVKKLTALFFVLLFWAVMHVSAYLLSFVGIKVLKEILEEAIVWMSLSGAMFGLALAVLHEMNTVVETMRNLAVRLLRLLLPIVAVVTAVFLMFVPVQGLEAVFGRVSAAGTVLSMAIIAISLITATLDASDELGTQNAFLLWCARVLSWLLPVMAGIALYAIYIRIQQYGWTPERLIAFLGTIIVFAYAFVYAIAALVRSDVWQDVIRAGNTYLALTLIGLCLLWLTPVLNAQYISTQSQMQRYLSDRMSAKQLPLWEFKEDWGRAGQAALAALRKNALVTADDELNAQLKKLDEAKSRYAYNKDWNTEEFENQISDLKKHVMVLPENAVEVDKFLRAIPQYSLESTIKSCQESKPCFLIVDDFVTDVAGHEAYFLMKYKTEVQIGFLMRSRFNGTLQHRHLPHRDFDALKWSELREAVLEGAFKRVPSPFMSLQVGDKTFTPFQ